MAALKGLRLVSESLIGVDKYMSVVDNIDVKETCIPQIDKARDILYKVITKLDVLDQRIDPKTWESDSEERCEH